MRAVLVALLVALPALTIAPASQDISQVVALVAVVAAALTFAEYFSTYPSIIEFRDAPPFNRLRFVYLAIMMVLLILVCRHMFAPTNLTAAIYALGMIIGYSIDFAYSPIRMMVIMLPLDAPRETVELVRITAGISYAMSVATLLIFMLFVRLRDWPHSTGAFNVWVNLPLFDPTSGGDVVARLRRDSTVNVALGFLLPFLIPAVVKAASDAIDPISLTHPQTLVWTMSAWAFLPTSMIMRGVALGRVAHMIEEQRRRAYAKAELLQAA